MTAAVRYMKRHERQQRAFEYLKTKSFNTKFPISEVDDAAGWSARTAYTNITKYWEGWVRHYGTAEMEVLPEFRRVTLEEFIRQSSQKRRTFATFEPHTYDWVSIFEFLLPLTRESQLRAALDNLFFADSLRERFDEIGRERLETIEPMLHDELSEDYIQRLLDVVEDLFGGYSIRHVSGRFRARGLLTRDQAANENAQGHPYLIDETTAVVTFIVPLVVENSEQMRAEAQRVRGLFEELFVKSVIRSVEGEDEVWLLEESPMGRKLHVFEKRR